MRARRSGDTRHVRSFIATKYARDQIVLGEERAEIRASREAHGATSPRTPERRITRDELLIRLLGLLPAQFDVVLFRVGIPPEYLAGTSAPQATRATEVIRYLEQQSQLERLIRILQDVAPAGTAADRRPAAADPP